MLKPLTLSVALAMSLPAATIAADADYALTIYSSAQPGQINVNALSSYGANGLPGYALVRDQRQMAVPKGRGEVRFTDVAKTNRVALEVQTHHRFPDSHRAKANRHIAIDITKYLARERHADKAHVVNGAREGAFTHLYRRDDLGRKTRAHTFIVAERFREKFCGEFFPAFCLRVAEAAFSIGFFEREKFAGNFLLVHRRRE